MIEDNGILPRIKGEHIAAAMRSLPPAELTAIEVVETEFEVPDIGRVRFTLKRHSSKKGKSRFYFWTAEKAVLTAPAGSIPR